MIASIAATVRTMPVTFTKRLLLAALISPPVPVLILVAIIGVSSGWRPIGSTDIQIFLVRLAVSYAGLLLCGFPAMLFLRRLGRLKLWTLTVAGGFCGVLQLLGMALNSAAPIEFIQIAWGAGFGASIALIFGIIAGISTRSSASRAAG